MVAKFIGEVVVQWVTHEGSDRRMRLTQPFGFEDGAGLRWDVPAGVEVDGASIPQIFWTTFGPPFVGDYRRASVVHDHYCVIRTRPSLDVHQMFYEGCVAGGVSQIKAKAMYLAVRTFGPSWEILMNDLAIAEGPTVAVGTALNYQSTMDLADFDKLMKWIETENPSIEAIDQRAEARTVRSPVIPGLPTPLGMALSQPK